MDDKELKEILATKAPAYQRSFIEIPRDSFKPGFSSLTDYLDKVVGYETKKLGIISTNHALSIGGGQKTNGRALWYNTASYQSQGNDSRWQRHLLQCW